MYTDFFGLKYSPFNNTPDPRFFFNTPDHEEAVASLVYAAQERKGFALLTGEVGSGKTLVSRLVLSRLERSAKFAVVHNTRVGPRELLFSICREFDVRVAADASAPEMSRALEEFLLDQYARDRLAVVIVDEAQHLTTESFEELRLLGNLEADDAKLLTVLILGQPELQDAFGLPGMEQLRQRLFRRYHLKALSRELTEGYITHRLRVAGIPKAQTVFERPALNAVYAASGGIPRLINQICDGAMLAAYSRSAKKITETMVEEVVAPCGPNSASSSENMRVTGQQPLTAAPTARSDAPQRVILDTGSAEESVRSLERRVRDAVADCERAQTFFERALTSAKDELTRIQCELPTNARDRRALTDEIDRHVETAKRELTTQIEEQRKKVEGVRSALTETAQRAARQVAGLRAIADQVKLGATTDLEAARAEMNRLIAEATRLGMDLERRSEGLSAQTTAAHAELRRLLDEMVANGQTRRSLAEEMEKRVETAKRDLASHIEEQRTRIETVRTEIETAAEAVAQKTEVLKAVADQAGVEAVADLQAARAELDRRIAAATRLGLDIESRSEGLSAQVTAALHEMQRVLQDSLKESKKAGDLLREQSESSIAQVRVAMEQMIERADTARRDLVELAEQMKSGSLRCVEGFQETAAGLLHQIDARGAAACNELGELADQVRSDSKQCVGRLHETTGELLRQIDDRGAAAEKAVQELADQARNGAARSVEGLKGIVAELLQQIDEKAAQIRGETEQSCDRMGRLEHRFGEGVVSAKAAVQQIIDDARARFDAAQLQVADILTQAQTAAAVTNEQAAIALAEARGAAQRLREQMEQDARRADAAAENSRRELQELRTDLRKDREQVREQIVESKALLSEARQEAARLIDQARSESSRLIEMANATTSRLYEEAGRFERESQARAERIIQHARETEGRVDSLLRLPKEIIDEANAKTAALAELSKSLSSVITQLSAAGAAARAQNQEIAEASELAQERLEGLRSHTTRVGQLVGIIRQLYGVMDARIEGLRGRLDQAENLCRTVPQEIDGLRSALGSGRNGEHAVERMRTNSARFKDAPPSTRSKANILKPAPGALPDRPAPAMLGDIVSRNRKLHEWLRETLREAESNAGGVNQDRIDRTAQEAETEKATA
ncbi:MAG TPA: AAA family ATPase [Phycisphaerae bacterium]|nr:AAA family ATPase [Phycisphaerae bacterium]